MLPIFAGGMPVALLLLFIGGARPPFDAAAMRDGPSVLANDNRRAAGRLAGGTLTVRLEARAGVWRPEGTDRCWRLLPSSVGDRRS